VFEETNLLADVKKNNVPIVIVGRDLIARGIDSIMVDNEAGGELAARHLKELGHRRIAVIRGPREMCDSEPRWVGIQKMAAHDGLELDPRLVFQLPGLADPASGFEGGLRLARKMLAAGRPFTAVIAFDDLTALGVVRGLTEAWLRIPDDCSVMGFDDVLPAEVATPAMTTIRQPLREMGVEAAERVLQAIKRGAGKAERPRLHKPSPELVIRKSTARPPTAVVETLPRRKGRTLTVVTQ
jgi:LacI family transcriptional regulator